jgi:hypothetical protein
MISLIRGKSSFLIISAIMALMITIISSIRQEAVAYMMSSKMTSVEETRASVEDLEAVQSFLEKRIVIQKLEDFGMSKEEAMSKVTQLDRKDLHTLASLVRSGPAGGDGLGIVIGIAVLAILVIIILKLLNKEIIIK